MVLKCLVNLNHPKNNIGQKCAWYEAYETAILFLLYGMALFVGDARCFVIILTGISHKSVLIFLEASKKLRGNILLSVVGQRESDAM